MQIRKYALKGCLVIALLAAAFGPIGWAAQQSSESVASASNRALFLTLTRPLDQTAQAVTSVELAQGASDLGRTELRVDALESHRVRVATGFPGSATSAPSGAQLKTGWTVAGACELRFNGSDWIPGEPAVASDLRSNTIGTPGEVESIELRIDWSRYATIAPGTYRCALRVEITGVDETAIYIDQVATRTVG